MDNNINDSNIKTIINKQDNMSLSTLSDRYIMSINSSNYETIKSMASTLHLVEVDKEFQVALAPSERRALRKAVVEAYIGRKEAFVSLHRLIDGYKRAQNSDQKMFGSLLFDVVNYYGMTFVWGRLSNQKVNYKNIVDGLKDSKLEAAITALSLKTNVDELADWHDKYENAYAQWIKFKSTHVVPSSLKSELKEALKESIDAIRVEMRHEKTGVCAELYATLVEHIHAVDTQRRKEKTEEKQNTEGDVANEIDE